MWGQWIAIVNEQVNGRADLTTVTVNIDRDQRSVGRVLVNALSRPLQAEGVITFAGEEPGATFDVRINSIAPWPANIAGPATVSGSILSISRDEMVLAWRSSWGESGELKLAKQSADPRSPADITIRSWPEFRVWVDSLPDPNNWIFRGQLENWQLQTSFHRTGRSDLLRYRDEAIPGLQDAIASMTGDWVVDLNDSTKFGSFLSLAQHHGFPTPLIDWTRSPYIAAYFAICDIPLAEPKACPRGKECPSAPAPESVRIVAFDTRSWTTGGYKAGLANPDPYICVQKFIPLGNTRWVQQQAVCTSTNLAAPEWWLRLFERELGRKHITTLDLPRSIRREAMRDLEYMGITAAGIYPGLDGACRAHKERYFAHA